MMASFPCICRHVSIFPICLRLTSNLSSHYWLLCGCRKDKELLCIIFVERIIAAKVIERVMKKITDFSHFNVSYVTGSNSSVNGLSSKAQFDSLESFCGGKVSVFMVHDVKSFT